MTWQKQVLMQTIILTAIPLVAHARDYSCRVSNYEFSQQCRYRWWEDLGRSVCGGYTVNRSKTVSVTANDATEACTAAKASIEDGYPKSYNSNNTCSFIKPFGGSRPAASHCIETIDTSNATCSCTEVVPPANAPFDETETDADGVIDENQLPPSNEPESEPTQTPSIDPHYGSGSQNVDTGNW